MPIVNYTLEVGKELTPEEEEKARLRIQEAKNRPFVYDPDCPLLTEKQLSEFSPVNFATMEERAEAMKVAGLIDEKGNMVIRELVFA